MDDDPSNKQSQQQQSYWEAIVSNRSNAISLQSDGTVGRSLFEKMATLNINYRINEERQHRCPVCWYCNVRCVCDLMPPNIVREDLPNVKILLLMHHKEYLNAGNSAKNLLALLPEQNIELYLYGKEGDFDSCLDEMMIDQGRRTAILWPCEKAISVEEFISGCLPIQSKNPKMMESGRSDNDEVTDNMLRIVALDGTYKNAKNMHKTIRRRLNEDDQTMPACIALHPKSVSQFHRAIKNYGKANERVDERALRVSTAEACALLMMELGAEESVQEKIIKALLVNNCNRGVI
jgi:DTW domain-containing protein YfiP